MKLKRWSIISKNLLNFQPPGASQSYLHGHIVGHPRIADGKEVTTSRIIARNGNKVVTNSGSEYELGPVDPEYEAEYPDAEERLLSNLLPRTDDALAVLCPQI